MAVNDKEAVYDESIAPLMSRIIDLCKTHKINMAAQFSLGEDPGHNGDNLWCTTVLQDVDPLDVKGVEMMRSIRRIVKPQAPLAAFMIITEGKP